MNLPLFWLLLALPPTTVTLVALGIAHLRRPCGADRTEAPAESSARGEINELLQSIGHLTDQLNNVSAAFRSSNSLQQQSGEGFDQPVSTMGSLEPSTQGSKGVWSPQSTVVPSVLAGAQADQAASSSDTGKRVADLAAQMRELMGLADNLHRQWQALERGAIDSPQARKNRAATTAIQHDL